MGVVTLWPLLQQDSQWLPPTGAAENESDQFRGVADYVDRAFKGED